MWTVFTVRKRSCGKVIFLHLSVSHSVHRGVSAQCMLGIHHPQADSPPGQTPSWADPPGRPPWADTPRQTPRDRHPPPPRRWLLLRTIRVLLECILVTCFVSQKGAKFTYDIFATHAFCTNHRHYWSAMQPHRTLNCNWKAYNFCLVANILSTALVSTVLEIFYRLYRRAAVNPLLKQNI